MTVNDHEFVRTKLKLDSNSYQSYPRKVYKKGLDHLLWKSNRCAVGIFCDNKIHILKNKTQKRKVMILQVV